MLSKKIDNIIIRRVFKENYFDLHVYRFLVFYRQLVYLIFGGWFVVGIAFAFMGFFDILLPWFYTSFAIVVAGGIDHIIIGSRLRLILRILEDKHGINITQNELMEICGDLINQ